MSRKWSSHFWGKVHVFSTFFNNKSKSCSLTHAKCLFMCCFSCQPQKKSPFLLVLTWFLILGKIQDGGQGGDHCWWCQRPPAVPPPIKYTSSSRGDQRLSTKIISEYCYIPKTLGGVGGGDGGGMNLHVHLRVNIVVGSGSGSTCIYINTYFPTCAQCSKVFRCLRTDVSKQFKNNPASCTNNAKLILKSSKI